MQHRTAVQPSLTVGAPLLWRDSVPKLVRRDLVWRPNRAATVRER